MVGFFENGRKEKLRNPSGEEHFFLLLETGLLIYPTIKIRTSHSVKMSAENL